MQKSKILKQIFLFALLSIVIFSFGGCGGGHSGSTDNSSDNDDGYSEDIQPQMNDDPEVLRVLEKLLEADNYGVPMIFDYAPLPENYDNTQSVTGTPINFLAYVSSEDLNKDGEFVKNFALEKDNEYIIKYSRAARTLNGSYLKFRITAPENQTMILDLAGIGKSSFDIELENRGVISKSIYVEAYSEVIPEEAPCIMLYSFKAPLTGNYEFAVKEANTYDFISGDIDETHDDEFPFEFRLYTVGEAHSAVDDEEIELSARQILDIQRILLEYTTEFDEYGLPTAFDEYDYYDEYDFSGVKTSETNSNGYRDKAYDVINGAKNSNSDKIIIAPRIDNIPYNTLYRPGAGFYAHSGLRSIQLSALYDDVFSDNALEDFTIEKPEGAYRQQYLSGHNISTEEEFLRLKGVEDRSNFTLLKDAIDNKDSKHAALGLAGTETIFVRYEFRESKPRMPSIDDIQIRSAVVKQLRENFNVFQREHGDYFVAGYTFGMFYEFSVTVQATPYDCWFDGSDISKDLPKSHIAQEIATMIANYIKDAFTKDLSKLDKASTLMWKLEEALRNNSRNVKISVSYINHSGMGSEKAFSSVYDLANDFYWFVRGSRRTPSSRLQRLYVTLMRYRELERVKKFIPEELPITAEHYNLIKELNKIVYTTQCYKNAIDLIPASHLINGEAKRDEWNKEFNEVYELYKNQLNRLCSDIQFVREYYNKFSALLDKYKGLNQRYVFYRHMMSYQGSVRNGVGDWKDSDAKWSYPHFRVGFDRDDVENNKYIRDDIQRGKEPSHGGPYGEADALQTMPDDYYDRSHSFGNYRPYYYEGGPINSNHSTGTDIRGHSFGKRSYHWKFSRPPLYDIEFKIEFRCVYMPEDIYPFTGLID